MKLGLVDVVWDLCINYIEKVYFGEDIFLMRAQSDYFFCQLGVKLRF